MTHWPQPLRRVFGKRRLTDKTKYRILDEADLSAKQKVEAELILTSQLDRLFAAMEKRLDHDERGRSRSRQVRRAVEKVLRRAKKYGSEHVDLLHLSVPPAHFGQKSRCRIATTNFDRLFEEAWADEFGEPLLSFDARIAPRAGAPGFEGIIHLHGVLDAKVDHPSDFVLSSRDFARVYLRSGVIANYVYDLIRRYVVVLVGYSADDPPMRISYGCDCRGCVSLQRHVVSLRPR